MHHAEVRVSRFKFPRRVSPLVDLLRGHFSKSSTGLPDYVRERVAEIFTLPFWDTHSSANRRRGALIWASQFELDEARDNQRVFELGYELDGAELREESDVVENRMATRISEFRSLLSVAIDGILPFEKVSAQLGPALFASDWIERLSEKEKWLIDEAKRRPNDVRTAGPGHNPLGLARWVPSNPIGRESLDAAKERQRFIGHLHRKGQDWLQARGIKTEAQFEEAFKCEFQLLSAGGADDGVIGSRSGQPQTPTYPISQTYSASAVPKQFTQWAEAQNRAGVIITAPLAEDAMRGPKNENGVRTGGLLPEGTGLARDTIRKWVKELDSSWRAEHGVPPSRSSKA
jgi:hypothetical protein